MLQCGHHTALLLKMAVHTVAWIKSCGFQAPQQQTFLNANTCLCEKGYAAILNLETPFRVGTQYGQAPILELIIYRT